MIIIDVTERRQRDGMFIARLEDGHELCVSRQPFLDAARVLLSEGVPTDTRITMRHAIGGTDSLSSTVGATAKLTVMGERFAPYALSRARP